MRTSRSERIFQTELRVGILGPLGSWVPTGPRASIVPLSLPRGILGVRWLVKSRTDGFSLGCCPGKRLVPKRRILACTPVSPNTANGSSSK